MELTSEELNLFELAFQLRIPLYKLMEEMTYEELLGWQKYFEERPPGRQEDYRIATLIRIFGSKDIDIEKIFPTLSNVTKKDNVVASLKGSAMFLKITNAKGGEKIGTE